MNHTLVALCVLVAAPALAKNPAPPPPSRFVFQIPDGWVDKTPPGTRGKVRLAFDDEHHLAFQAKVSPGSEPVTLAFLDKYATESQKAVKRITGGELTVIKKDGFDVAGIISARFIFEAPPPPDKPDATPARQVQYYVPIAGEHAVMTFTAPSATFDQYLELFDKTARATTVKK